MKAPLCLPYYLLCSGPQDAKGLTLRTILAGDDDEMRGRSQMLADFTSERSAKIGHSLAFTLLWAPDSKL